MTEWHSEGIQIEKKYKLDKFHAISSKNLWTTLVTHYDC